MHNSFEVGAELPPLTVEAINSSANAKGSIHDDEKAKEMGYEGGFVPGVTVLGYMLRLIRSVYGNAALEGLEFEGRLRRPTYAGVAVTVTGSVMEATDEGVALKLAVVDPKGDETAVGTARLRVPINA